MIERTPLLAAALAALTAVGCSGDGTPDYVPSDNGGTNANNNGLNGGQTTGMPSPMDDGGMATGDGGMTTGDGGMTTADSGSTTDDGGTTGDTDSGCPDGDSDGVCDAQDVCEGHDDNQDTDSDGTPNGCDVCTGENDALDGDSDGVPDACDVCEGFDDTLDADDDETPDGCDDDADNDGVANDADNCPNVANADQANFDGDPEGDACDDNIDGDGANNDVDSCPLVPNDGDGDADGDGVGDKCDLCEGADDATAPDGDDDGVCDTDDQCPGEDDLLDSDDDDTPNCLDEDDDNDGRPDDEDNCPVDANADQADLDGDGEGDACDADDDGDMVDDNVDNCPRIDNGPNEADVPGVGNQTNTDGVGDGGDACDTDDDNDGVADGVDNCQFVANGEAEADVPGVGNQTNTDGADDGGDACDDDDDDDTVPDESDRCPASDDREDDDEDGVPDGCDVCEGSDDTDDFDGDGVPDGCDPCGPGKELGGEPTLWLRLGEDSGSSAPINQVTEAPAGTYGPGMRLNEAGPTEDFDGAALFEGVQTNVTLRNVASFPTTAFTLSMWVQFNSPLGDNELAAEQTILSYATSAADDALVLSLVNDEGTEGRIVVAGNEETFDFEPTPRRWYHLAVTWDSVEGDMEAYVDGSRVSTESLSEGLSLAAGGNLVLGQAQDGFAVNPTFVQAARLRGGLDEFAVYDHVLSEDEIALIANAFCKPLPADCKTLLDKGLSRGDGEYRLYPASLSGVGFDAECDMTTEGGGWTKCGNVNDAAADTTDACVAESDSYPGRDSEADFVNFSFCKKLFDDVAPTGMMVHNRTTDDSGGFSPGTDERVFVDWSETAITPGIYPTGDEAIAVTCYSTKPDGSVKNTYSDCRYMSHQDEDDAPWQKAMWSFADGLTEPYSDNWPSRVLLGPTYEACSDVSGPRYEVGFHNFAGRSEPTLFLGQPTDRGWAENDNIGDLYLR